MLLRQGIRYWLLLGYNIVYILSYSFLQPLFFFWDTVICVIKAKYKINKIYVIKARYTLMVIARL